MADENDTLSRPFTFWDDLQREYYVASSSAVKNNGFVVPSNAGEDDDEDNTIVITSNTTSTAPSVNANGSAVILASNGMRIANLLSIMPTTQQVINAAISSTENNSSFQNASSAAKTVSRADDFVYLEAAGFLAMHHFNQRSNQVLPHLTERLGGCNLYLTMDMMDSGFSPIQALQHVLDRFKRTSMPGTVPRPVSILGSYRSAVSFPLSLVAAAYKVPQMNCCSTSSDIDNQQGVSATFLRTIPTNQVDARATLSYLVQEVGMQREFGILFTLDAYGRQYAKDLQQIAATEFGIDNVYAVSYENGNEESIRQAVESLRVSGLRYFLGVLAASPSTVKTIIREARAAQIMGGDQHLWLLASPAFLLTTSGFYQTMLDSTQDEDIEIARAISGVGVILLETELNQDFEQSMKDLGNDKELLDYYVSLHGDTTTFDGFEFQATSPSPVYQHLMYDAVMTLGIALCESEQDFISTEELVTHIKKSTQFEGLSGPVRFDPQTGTRTAETVTFQVINVVVNATKGQPIAVDARKTATIHLATGVVNAINPFVYADGSTNVPPELPPIEQNLNLIPDGVRAMAWSLSILIILLSLAFGSWTHRYRNKNIVRAAQPFFLQLSCIGTILMATSIIPMSLQEPLSAARAGLDMACVAFPWLFTIGYGIASSALLCKALRLNVIVDQAINLKRITVQTKDMLWPFLVPTSLNILILTLWTTISPPTWNRQDITANYDRYGRSLESYGKCEYMGSGQEYFIVALFVVNAMVVVFGNWQSYLTKDMPSSFNEASYVAISMMSCLESVLLGVPTLLMIQNSPAVSLTVHSLLIFFVCLAIQLPLFMPKIFMKWKSDGNRRAAGDAWGEMINLRRSIIEQKQHRTSKTQRCRASFSCGFQIDNHHPSIHDGSTVNEIRARALLSSLSGGMMYDDSSKSCLPNTTHAEEIRAPSGLLDQSSSKLEDSSCGAVVPTTMSVAEIRARVSRSSSAGDA